MSADRSERLAGRRALVTGAAGGLGCAICQALAREGARIALAGRSPAALEALAERLQAGGASVLARAFDVARLAEVERHVDACAAALDGIDLLVNAAAIDTGWARAAEMSPDVWRQTIEVNLTGTYNVCRSVLPLLVAAGGGTIVNVTSVAGQRAWPLDAAYNASKAGVEMLTRTIAVEYARDGVRANTLAPGVIDAGLTDQLTDADERSQLVAMHPLGRMGKPEEVAEAAVWLSCRESSFTTGSMLRVDGGFLS